MMILLIRNEPGNNSNYYFVNNNNKKKILNAKPTANDFNQSFRKDRTQKHRKYLN